MYKLGDLGEFSCESTGTASYEEAEFLAEGYADLVVRMINKKLITPNEAKERAILLAGKLKRLSPKLNIKMQVLWRIQKKYNEEIEPGLITFLKEQA